MSIFLPADSLSPSMCTTLPPLTAIRLVTSDQPCRSRPSSVALPSLVTCPTNAAMRSLPSCFLLHLLPSPNSVSHHLILFSWSTAGLTATVNNTDGHTFQAIPLPLSLHDLPFTLPLFLYQPRADMPHCLVASSGCRISDVNHIPSSPAIPGLSHHLKCRPTPMPLLGTTKAAALLGSRGDFPLHVARPPLATVVAVGQVPLGLVCSLLDLPRPWLSLVYSSWRPSLSHRVATVTIIFFSSRMSKQTPPRDFWLATMIMPTFPPISVPARTRPSSSLLFGHQQQWVAANCVMSLDGCRRPLPVFTYVEGLV